MNLGRARCLRPGGQLAAVRRLLRADRGSSAVELAILAPALLLLTMIIIQFALWFQARQAALAAAQEGARLARVLSVDARPGWQGLAQDKTMGYYNGLGTHILTMDNGYPVAFADPKTGTAGVTVKGTVNSLLGGMTITVTVKGPQECFHPKNPAAGEGPCG